MEEKVWVPIPSVRAWKWRFEVTDVIALRKVCHDSWNMEARNTVNWDTTIAKVHTPNCQSCKGCVDCKIATYCTGVEHAYWDSVDLLELKPQLCVNTLTAVATSPTASAMSQPPAHPTPPTCSPFPSPALALLSLQSTPAGCTIQLLQPRYKQTKHPRVMRPPLGWPIERSPSVLMWDWPLLSEREKIWWSGLSRPPPMEWKKVTRQNPDQWLGRWDNHLWRSIVLRLVIWISLSFPTLWTGLDAAGVEGGEEDVTRTHPWVRRRGDPHQLTWPQKAPGSGWTNGALRAELSLVNFLLLKKYWILSG